MSDSTPPPAPLCLRHQIGDVIKDRYAIRDVLGAGAFGTVYRVEETIGARTLVLAAKEMHVLDDPSTNANERVDALRMFEEEAFLLQTLRHPHIPAAYFESAKAVWLACPICGRTFKGARTCPDHGSELQVVKERYYLIMDFIEGPDLEQKLQENGGRPLEESQVIDWTLQVCDALEAVHAKGLSHRDIKPANIKLNRHTGQAMLIDFGLVKPSEIAGGYGTMRLAGVSRMGTLGYAPVSPAEQAHPDARSDILALGMTVYRLLTGLEPTDPAQLEMMRQKAPHKLNSAISLVLNDIILKAIEPEPQQRYKDVATLSADLRAARFPVETKCGHCGYVYRSIQAPEAGTLCPQCARPLKPPETPKSAAKAAPAKAPASSHGNPFEPRIAQIRAEINAPMPSASAAFDKRINDLEALLAMSEGFTKAAVNTCPSCHQAQLLHVSGEWTGQCPICTTTPLQQRVVDWKKCPVCREGTLQDEQVGNLPFCAVCRAAPLQLDERRRFLVIDLWWKCSHCRAEYDEIGGRRAILRAFEQDPFGVGAREKDQAHTPEEWQQLSGRGTHFCRCTNCNAQWDKVDEHHMALAYFTVDPFQVCARYRRETLTRLAWAKIAQGWSPTAGTHFCPHCHIDWNLDAAQQLLMMLDFDHKAPNWAQAMRGKALPMQTWVCAGLGKNSQQPGFLCPNCRTEFDHEGALLKLIASPSPKLQPYVTQKLPLTDWHRRAGGAPTGVEAQQLRNELSRLQNTRTQEQNKAVRAEQERRLSLQEELNGLYKQGILEGFIPLQRVSPNTSSWRRQGGTFVVFASQHAFFLMRPGETVRWEGSAHDGVLPQNVDGMSWLPLDEGLFVVTNERIMFARGSSTKWARQISDFKQVEAYRTVRSTAVLALKFKTSTQSFGFEIGNVTWTLMADGQERKITFTPEDLMHLLNSLATP